MQNKIAIGFIAAAAILGGCATTLPPTGSMENSLATIRAAEEVGAANIPQAKLHLELAKEQNKSAEALMEKELNEEAGFVIMRAEADAELSLAMARENAARIEAQQANDKLVAPKN